MRPGRGLLLAWLLVGCAGPGAPPAAETSFDPDVALEDAVPEPDAEVVWVRDVVVAPEDVPWTPPCDLAAVAAILDDSVRPGLIGCHVCHDMTVHSGLLKAPGPQWYHPEDSVAIVQFLLDNDLIDGHQPSSSMFLLKPLPPACGGANHTGGDAMGCDDATHAGFLTFVTAAADCVRGAGLTE